MKCLIRFYTQNDQTLFAVVFTTQQLNVTKMHHFAIMLMLSYSGNEETQVISFSLNLQW